MIKISYIIKTIKKIGEFILTFIRWIKDVGISRKMRECFECDIYNLVWYLMLLLFTSGLIIWIFGVTFIRLEIQSIFLLYYFYYLSFVYQGLLVLSLIFLLIALVTVKRQYNRSLTLSKEKLEFDAQGPHHGIVFTRYTNRIKDIAVLDIIVLFVEGFFGKVPYRIYECSSMEQFEELYYNTTIKWLWILGHGDRGGLCYGVCDEDHYIRYSDLNPEPSKLFIAQLHCNSGKGRSLVELNNLPHDFDLNHYRMSLQNRCYIIRKIPEFIANREILTAISKNREWL